MSYDQQLLLWFHDQASPFWDDVASAVTVAGSVGVVAIVAAVIFAYLWSRGQRRASVTIFTGVYGAIVGSVLLKELIGRPRPELWDRFTVESSYSMPSSHAMGTMALVACIVIILWSTRWRVHSIVVGALYLLLIGASRLYLGVHYPTDVLAGWLFGALWVAAVYWGVSRLPATRSQ